MEVLCNSIRAIDFLSLHMHHMAKIIKRPQINNRKKQKKKTKWSTNCEGKKVEGEREEWIKGEEDLRLRKNLKSEPEQVKF